MYCTKEISTVTLKFKIMSSKELNIGNALLVSVEILKRMISGGLNDPKMFLYVSNMLIDEFYLTKEESIIVLENAIELC